MADEAINAYAAGIIDGEGCITAGLNLALADLQSNAKKGNGPLPAEVVAAKHEALAEFRRLNMRGRV